MYSTVHDSPHTVYVVVVVCGHPDPLLHPPDTTTPLLARYFLIKIWLPGNRLQSCLFQCAVHRVLDSIHFSRSEDYSVDI